MFRAWEFVLEAKLFKHFTKLSPLPVALDFIKVCQSLQKLLEFDR